MMISSFILATVWLFGNKEFCIVHTTCWSSVDLLAITSTAEWTTTEADEPTSKHVASLEWRHADRSRAWCTAYGMTSRGLPATRVRATTSLSLSSAGVCVNL